MGFLEALHGVMFPYFGEGLSYGGEHFLTFGWSSFVLLTLTDIAAQVFVRRRVAYWQHAAKTYSAVNFVYAVLFGYLVWSLNRFRLTHALPWYGGPIVVPAVEDASNLLWLLWVLKLTSITCTSVTRPDSLSGVHAGARVLGLVFWLLVLRHDMSSQLMIVALISALRDTIEASVLTLHLFGLMKVVNLVIGQIDVWLFTCCWIDEFHYPTIWKNWFTLFFGAGLITLWLLGRWALVPVRVVSCLWTTWTTWRQKTPSPALGNQQADDVPLDPRENNRLRFLRLAAQHYNQFSPQQAENIVEVFQLLDQDNNGRLDVNELAEGLKKFDPTITVAKAHDMMREFDTEKGDLDFLEFCGCIAQVEEKGTMLGRFLQQSGWIKFLKSANQDALRLSMSGTLEDDGPKDGFVCVVCCDHQRNILFEPCLHMAVCAECDAELKKRLPYQCPVCRQAILRSKKIFVN